MSDLVRASEWLQHPESPEEKVRVTVVIQNSHREVKQETDLGDSVVSQVAARVAADDDESVIRAYNQELENLALAGYRGVKGNKPRLITSLPKPLPFRSL